MGLCFRNNPRCSCTVYKFFFSPFHIFLPDPVSFLLVRSDCMDYVPGMKVKMKSTSGISCLWIEWEMIDDGSWW